MGIRMHAKWEKYIVLKKMSELETNELEKCNKKLQHSYKELNKSMSEQDNAYKCNISKNKSHYLKAHGMSIQVDNVEAEGI